MAFHVFLFFLLLCLAWLWHLYWLHHNPPHPKVGAIYTKLQRLLKPRSPLDCPACRLSSTLSSGMGPSSLPVRPWREVKSQRGAPKRLNGEYAQTLHQRSFCNLRLPHLQLDELRTRLRCSTQVRLSLVGHRSPHEDSSRTLSRHPHTTCSAHGHPLPATPLGSRLPPALHQ
jgi:hypothetical protein